MTNQKFNIGDLVFVKPLTDYPLIRWQYGNIIGEIIEYRSNLKFEYTVRAKFDDGYHDDQFTESELEPVFTI